MMRLYELFRLFFHGLFGWTTEGIQFLLKGCKLFIIYVSFNCQDFRVTNIPFNLDFVSFIKEYWVFSLVPDEKKS